MIFRQIVKRDGTHEVSVAEDWPDEDRIMKNAIGNEDIFFLEDGELRIVVKNGMATYKVYQEDANTLFLKKISSSIDRT